MECANVINKAWDGIYANPNFMATILSKMKKYKQALLLWQANVKKEEQQVLKTSMRQLRDLQDEEQGQHTKINKKIQEAIIHKLADDEIK